MASLTVTGTEIVVRVVGSSGFSDPQVANQAGRSPAWARVCDVRRYKPGDVVSDADQSTNFFAGEVAALVSAGKLR